MKFSYGGTKASRERGSYVDLKLAWTRRNAKVPAIVESPESSFRNLSSLDRELLENATGKNVLRGSFVLDFGDADGIGVIDSGRFPGDWKVLFFVGSRLAQRSTNLPPSSLPASLCISTWREET